MKNEKKSTRRKTPSSGPRPSDAPAGRQAMLPSKEQAVSNSDAAEKVRTGDHHSERASPQKWKRIQKRAGELAVLDRKQPGEVMEKHLRRAKRELLGVQTMPDPDNPLSIKQS
jgi:hypothetical protein